MKAEQLQLALRPRPRLRGRRPGRAHDAAQRALAGAGLPADGAAAGGGVRRDDRGRALAAVDAAVVVQAVARPHAAATSTRARPSARRRRFDDAWEARRRAPWLPMLALADPVARCRSGAPTRCRWRSSRARPAPARRQRVKAIVRSHRGAATMMQSTFSWIVLFLVLGPGRAAPVDDAGPAPVRATSSGWATTASSPSCSGTWRYAAAVLFVEPFFVAAGFAMYLNRRVELEAWDVEQDLRHAFAPR